MSAFVIVPSRIFAAVTALSLMPDAVTFVKLLPSPVKVFATMLDAVIVPVITAVPAFNKLATLKLPPLIHAEP